MTNRVFVGQLNGTMGLYVSQAGYDVTTCDSSLMLFNSQGRMSQILATGSVVFQPNTSGTQNVPITNNTSGVPIGVFYETIQVGSGTATSALYNWTTYSLTNNNLAITLPSTLTTSGTLTVVYIIFTDNTNG